MARSFWGKVDWSSGMKRSKDAGRVEESAGSGGKEAREAAEKKASQWHRTNIPWMLDWRTDLTQILLPVEPGAPYLSGGAGSNAPGVKWSTVDKDSAVDVSVDGYTASCLTGEKSFLILRCKSAHCLTPVDHLRRPQVCACDSQCVWGRSLVLRGRDLRRF